MKEEHEVIWEEDEDEDFDMSDDILTAQDFYRSFPRYLVLGDTITLNDLEGLGFTVYDEGDDIYNIIDDDGNGFVMDATNNIYLKSVILRRSNINAMKRALRLIMRHHQIELIRSDSEFLIDYTLKKKKIESECKKMRDELT